MANPTTGELVLRNVWDEETRSLKITMADSEFAVALRKEDGDSVMSHPASLVLSDLSTIRCDGMKTAALYVEPGTGAAKVQVSPIDSGDVWMDTDITVTAGVSVAVKIGTICARRIRIVITAGSPVCHLVVQAV